MNDKLWNDAQASVKKQRPDWDAANPRFWNAVTGIYKSAGGELSEAMEKSMAAVERAVRVTPAFIENPRLWVGAIQKSCGGSMKWGVDDFNAIVKAYTVSGGKLTKSCGQDFSFGYNIAKSIAGQFDRTEDTTLEKAQGVHKYTGRVAKPGGGWKYIYGAGDATAATSKAAPAKKATTVKTPEPDKSKTDMAGIVEKLSKKDAKAQRAALQNASDDALTAIHGSAKGGLQQAASDERAARKVKAANQKTDAQKSQGEDDFEVFKSQYSEDIRKSLAESHPEWDAETLDRRAVSQTRQMYRLHA